MRGKLPRESMPFGVGTGISQGCVKVTILLHKDMEAKSGVTRDYRLDGKLFNIRRFKGSKLPQSYDLTMLTSSNTLMIITPEGL